MKFVELISFTSLPIIQVIALGIVGVTLGVVAFRKFNFGKPSSLEPVLDDPIWPDTPI